MWKSFWIPLSPLSPTSISYHMLVILPQRSHQILDAIASDPHLIWLNLSQQCFPVGKHSPEALPQAVTFRPSSAHQNHFFEMQFRMREGGKCMSQIWVNSLTRREWEEMILKDEGNTHWHFETIPRINYLWNLNYQKINHVICPHLEWLLTIITTRQQVKMCVFLALKDPYIFPNSQLYTYTQ